MWASRWFCWLLSLFKSSIAPVSILKALISQHLLTLDFNHISTKTSVFDGSRLTRFYTFSTCVLNLYFWRTGERLLSGVIKNVSTCCYSFVWLIFVNAFKNISLSRTLPVGTLTPLSNIHILKWSFFPQFSDFLTYTVQSN